MKLKIIKRATANKSEVKRLRREGFIPAVLYVKGKVGETLAIHSVEFNAFLRHVKPGHLPTSKFTLVDEQGKEHSVIIKDIQYNIINYKVIHLDFEELVDNTYVNVKIPVVPVNEAECVGIKLGGVLRQPIRHIRIRCLPQDMPEFFQVDVAGLNLRQSKRVSDLDIPETVRPLAPMNEVVAVIVKR